MDAVALLVNGQQVGQSQKASGGRWTCSFPPRSLSMVRTVPGRGPSMGTSQPEQVAPGGHGRRGYSLGLLTSSHQGCIMGIWPKARPRHMAQASGTGRNSNTII